MEMHQLFAITERHPEQFAAAESFEAFARSLDASKPGDGRWLQHIAESYPGQWEPGFQTLKIHGFMNKPLYLPRARKASDIFAHVGLYPMALGGVYRCDIPYVVARAAFVSALRAPGFDYFGRLGADYVRNGKPYIAGGQQMLTAAKPSRAVIDAYGDAGEGDWDLATFEAVRWGDGRTLIIAGTHNGFGRRWLAVLDAGETALSMLSEHELGEIEAERVRRDAQMAAIGNGEG